MTASVGRAAAAALLLSSSALPAFAQTGLCGGLGDNGQWLGGDEAASDIATSPDYLEQMALVLQDNTYVGLFALSAPLDVRIEAEARGSGDTVIEIYDAAGALVLSDDDSGGNRASFVEGALQPGSFCVSLRSYDGAPLTGFVRVGRLEHARLTEPLAIPPIDEVEGDDYSYAQPCTAAMVQLRLAEGPINAAIAGGGQVSGSAPVTDLRYWGFSLAEPAAISITAENPGADPVIALYDSFGSWLAENDDFDGLNSRIDMSAPLQPGEYCIAVSALGDPAAPITVAVSAHDPAAALIGMYRRGEAAPPLDGTYPITRLGRLDGRVRQDLQAGTDALWYTVDIPEQGVLVAEAVTNNMGDPVLVVFDDFGRQLAYNDDYGDSLDSLVAVRVNRGTYVIGVRLLYAETPVLTRLLIERYVPVP